MTGLMESVRVFADAAAGLQHETDLFAGKGAHVTVWTTHARGIVCPRRYERAPKFAETAERLKAMGWPVYLRATGGGAVPQGPGVANMAIIFDAPGGFTIEDGYRLLTGVMTDALGPAGQALQPGDTHGSFCDGAWNLSVQGRKLVGTAQRWRNPFGMRPRVLAHMMILIDDRFLDGADAVAAFHTGLGLDPVKRAAHTDLATAFGLQELPFRDMVRVARDALSGLEVGSPE